MGFRRLIFQSTMIFCCSHHRPNNFEIHFQFWSLNRSLLRSLVLPVDVRLRTGCPYGAGCFLRQMFFIWQKMVTFQILSVELIIHRLIIPFKKGHLIQSIPRPCGAGCFLRQMFLIWRTMVTFQFLSVELIIHRLIIPFKKGHPIQSIPRPPAP